MSRIGRRPIELPAGVMVALSPGRVQVNGPRGELTQTVPARMQIEKTESEIVVTRPTERGDDRALHGLTRTLIANMVEGVTNGFEKHLEIQGVGYRAQLKGTDLELAVGYSHPVVVKPRKGISFDVPTPTQIVVKGIDKQMVGQTAAEVRKVRPPEPYKGKGIRYRDEQVRRKVGKRSMINARLRFAFADKALRAFPHPPRSSAGGRPHERHDQASSAPAPPSPGSREGRRHGRAASPYRLPLESRHFRAAHRR